MTDRVNHRTSSESLPPTRTVAQDQDYIGAAPMGSRNEMRTRLMPLGVSAHVQWRVVLIQTMRSDCGTSLFKLKGRVLITKL